MSDWNAVHIGVENDGVVIDGLDVWKQTWRATSHTIQLPHPQYPDQSHRYVVYEIGDVSAPVRFAAGELSNGVWGFYVPTPASASKTRSTAPPPASWKTACLALLTVLVLSVAAFGAGGAWLCGYLPVQPFSSAKWKDPTNDGVRLSMVDALVRAHRLEGMRRDEVIELLGPAPDTNYFRDWDAVYWLGPERGWLRLDSEWLVLRFGPDDRVTEWSIVSD